MPNPFIHGGRIEKSSDFVGRNEELRYIFNRLEAIVLTGQPQSISIVGPRRIGKSSLLHHLTQIYCQSLSQPDIYLFAHLDLESATCQTLSGLLGSALKSFLGQIQIDESPDLEELHRRFQSIRDGHMINLVEFEETIKDIGHLPGPRRWPILCLDELERLMEKPKEFPLDVYQSWRSLISANQIVFIVASMRSLVELAELGGMTSPFFNAFDRTLLPLGEFPFIEAKELLERGRACDRPFQDIECQQILRLAGNHPWHLQVVGSLVYEAKTGGQAVDWKVVHRRYKQQVNSLPLLQPWWHTILVKFGQFLRWLIQSPKYIGRLVLLLLQRPTEEEVTNWLAGTIIIIIVSLVVAGVIGWDDVNTWIELLLGQK